LPAAKHSARNAECGPRTEGLQNSVEYKRRREPRKDGHGRGKSPSYRTGRKKSGKSAVFEKERGRRHLTERKGNKRAEKAPSCLKRAGNKKMASNNMLAAFDNDLENWDT